MPMKFKAPLLRGSLIKRYKRFLADVLLEDGRTVTAHCANPGAMLGLKTKGSEVWLAPALNPKRKLPFSWELIKADQTLVGINTMLPNKLVEEALDDDLIEELVGYQRLLKEVKYGTNSRIDFLLKSQGRRHCYLEVKNVHLCRQKNLAEFPDSVTARGAKHLAELTRMVQNGQRAVILYIAQRSDCKRFTIAEDLDPKYKQASVFACKQGVEIYSYYCKVSTNEIKIKSRLDYIS